MTCAWRWMPSHAAPARMSVPATTMKKPSARRAAAFRLESFIGFPFWPLRVESGIDQLHVRAGHEAFDVGKDQHALPHRAETGDETGVERRAELRRRTDLVGRQRDDVGHRVDHDPDDALGDAQD